VAEAAKLVRESHVDEMVASGHMVLDQCDFWIHAKGGCAVVANVPVRVMFKTMVVRAQYDGFPYSRCVSRGV